MKRISELLIALSWGVYLMVLVVGSLMLIYAPIDVALAKVERIASPRGSETWSYDGATNPQYWAGLSDEFRLCELGQMQSPIDLASTQLGRPNTLEFHYRSTPLSVVNTGHTIQVNDASGSTVRINNQTYELMQFHFHTPSEHQIEGETEVMELHLVHRLVADNKLDGESSGEFAGEFTNTIAVIGVRITTGDENPTIEHIWEAIPAPGEVNNIPDQMINVRDLLPSQHDYFSYEGSLTTPPCREGIVWGILSEPIEISDAQLATFERLYAVNARPLQPRHDRRIEFHAVNVP